MICYNVFRGVQLQTCFIIFSPLPQYTQNQPVKFAVAKNIVRMGRHILFDLMQIMKSTFDILDSFENP